jgi:hypothetical protein
MWRFGGMVVRGGTWWCEAVARQVWLWHISVTKHAGMLLAVAHAERGKGTGVPEEGITTSTIRAITNSAAPARTRFAQHQR